MDKNTITGIVLIGLLLFGFTFYQNKQYQKQAAYQAQLDSIALVKQIQADSIAAVEAAQRMSSDTASVAQVAAAPVSIYKDSLLEAAHSAEAQIVTLANDKFEVAFTTKGAKPYSVKINEYSSYGGGESMPERRSIPRTSTLWSPRRLTLRLRCVCLSLVAATSSRDIRLPKDHIQ